MKSQLPLVSIIVNCHNGQKYLKKCIKSILNQSYKNWELIFWDNCSTDKSIKIANNFKDKRIKIFRSKSFYKLYHARNLALSRCKGKYVCFCDTDDMWIKQKLKLQIKEITKDNNLKILYSNYYVLNELKNKKLKKFNKILPSGVIGQKLLNSYDVGILTVMIEKKLLYKNQFNSYYNIIGDFDLFIYLSLKNKIKAIQKPLAIYRVHNQNLSTNKLDIFISEINNWLNKNEKKSIYSKLSFKMIKILLIKLKIKNFMKKFFN